MAVRIKLIAPYLAFAFIGVVLFSATYAILFFFKDLYITWARKDDRSFFYKYVTLKPYIKHVYYFAAIISIFWIVTLFLEWRKFIIFSGFMIFLTIYIILNIKYYLVDNNNFDYFDEIIWFYRKVRKIKAGKIKVE